MRIVSWTVSALRRFPIALPSFLQTLKTPELLCLQNTVLHASDCKEWKGAAAPGYTCHWANLHDPTPGAARATTGGVATWQAKACVAASNRLMPTPGSGTVGLVVTKGRAPAPIAPFPGHPLLSGFPGLVLVSDHIDFVLINCALPPGLKSGKRQQQRMRMMRDLGGYLKLLVTVGRDAVVVGNFNCALSETDTAEEGWMVDPMGAEWLQSLGDEARVVDAFRYFYPKERTYSTFISPEKNARAKGVRSSTVLATLPFLEECVQDCSYVRSLPGFLHEDNAALLRKDAKMRAFAAKERRTKHKKQRDSDEKARTAETPRKFEDILPQHRPLILHYTERQVVPSEEELLMAM